MTLTQIRDLLRVLIDSPNTSIWSNSNLNTLIFSEYRDLINAITDRWPDYYTKAASVVTIASNKYTALPSDCTLIKKLTDDDGNTVKWIHNSQFDHTAADTEPLYFDVVGRNIWWNPEPDAVYTYTCYYHYQPTDLSGESDTPELPPDFHDILAYAAAVNARIAKEEQIDEYMMKYERKLERLMRRIAQSQTNNARRVLHTYDASEVD